MEESQYVSIILGDKKINLGIEILRVILCFWVISFHYLDKQNLNDFLFIIIKKKVFHVPCFCFISFFFTHNIFNKKNINSFKKRIKRLLIPFIIWPLIIFILHNIIYKNNRISLIELKLQIILGNQFMVHFWYYLSILIITMLFFIICNFSNFLFIILLLSILSYIIQYTESDKFLYKYKNKAYSIEGTIRLIPIAGIGVIFASNYKIEILKINRKKTLFLSFLFLYFLFKNNIFIELGGYNGIIHIFASLFLFIGFYLIPFEYLYINLKILIKQISRFSNGIYCLHGHIFLFLKIKLNARGNFKTILMVYLFGYFISFIGFKLFKKTNFKYLFI